MSFVIDTEHMLQRFLTYVKVHTTSSETCEETPSTQRQFDLAKILAKELEGYGLKNVRLDKHCYVYGVLPERGIAKARAGKIPTVGLIAHMDVSDAVAGENVKPIVHRRYAGGPIPLPGDPSVILAPDTDRPLGECVGLDLVTSDGTTLLGADDKAGIAIIMAALKFYQDHPDVPHGPIEIAFTPDEEVGRGVEKFDLTGFGAEIAYTLDGEGLGEVEDETFCADAMDVIFHGVNVHPGFAKDKMVNSLKLAAAFIEALPKNDTSPETTCDREPYVHPRLITGNEEKTVVKFLIRDFEMDGLPRLERMIEERARAVVARVPGAKVDVEVSHTYKNMKVILDQRPEVSVFAEEAIKQAGLKVVKKPIRGGTDGSRLSFMGLPTANLFTGGHNYHGKKEWVAVQHMERAAECVLRLLGLWAEKGEIKGRLPPVA